MISFKVFLETAKRELPEGYYIVIKERNGLVILEIVYIDNSNLQNSKVIGHIRSYQSNKCQNVWHVSSVISHIKGFGPLLYDLAMEYVTSKDGYLCRDSAHTSADAINIWNYYFNKRPDVQRTPIPEKCNKLKYDIDEESVKYMYRKPDMSELTRLKDRFVKGNISEDSLETVAYKLGLIQ